MSGFDAGFAQGVAWAASVADKALERVKALPPTTKHQAVVGALDALADELRADLARAAAGGAVPVAVGAISAPAGLAAAEEARLKGYEGDPCPDCGAMTMVRNGTCLKCETCGATTGCS
jgi:ribonucleoside-diphosphate reductase alpha chain